MVNFIILNKLQKSIYKSPNSLSLNEKTTTKPSYQHTRAHLKHHRRRVRGKTIGSPSFTHIHTHHKPATFTKYQRYFRIVQSYSSYSRQHKPGEFNLRKHKKCEAQPFCLDCLPVLNWTNFIKFLCLLHEDCGLDCLVDLKGVGKRGCYCFQSRMF